MLGLTRQRVNEKHVGSELSQGLGHFRTAATLAAGGTAKRISPAITSTRERMAPRMEQAREVAGRAWEQRIKRSAEATTKRAKSAEKMSRRAQRNARRASMDATRIGRRAMRRQATRPGGMGGQAMKRQAMEARPHRRRRWMLGALGIGALIGAIGAMISRRRSPEWEEYEPTEPATGAMGETVTEMAEARRKTGSVVEGTGGQPSGRHSAESERESGASGTRPTTEPSSMRSPDARPPGT